MLHLRREIIKDMFNKVHKKLKRINPFLFILVMSFIKLVPFMVLLIIMYIIMSISTQEEVNEIIHIADSLGVKDTSRIVKLILEGIIFPIIETIVCICIPIELMKKIKFISKNDILIAIICSVIFGFLHNQMIIRQIYISIIILIDIYAYMIYRNNKIKAIIVAATIHGIYNTMLNLIPY